jgi:hypothetical protein
MSDKKPIEANIGSEEIRQKLEQLVQRACSDSQLKQRLLNDPESVLRENGVEIPAGTKPRVVMNKDSVSFEFLPQTTGDDAELTENAMSTVVGGGTNSTSSSTSTHQYLTFTFKQVFVTSVQ